MDVAAELISRGEAGGGTVIMTAHQSAGRGTHGRTWTDEPGSALLVTMILDDARVDALLPLRVGVALCDLLESLGIGEPRIKWPNDCMCADAKIAGILTRLEPPHALVGVGLNVTAAPAAEATSVAAELARAAAGGTSGRSSEPARAGAGGLSETAGAATGRATASAATITPESVLELFLVAICRRLGTEDAGRDCAERLWRLGQSVIIEQTGGREMIRGTIAGVSGDGALIISRNNREERIYAGRIRV